MKKIYGLGLLAIFSCTLLVLGLLVVFYFDSFVDSQINNELVIRNGSDTYENWVEPPIVPYIKFFFFNVTNSLEYLANGAKPILKEIGPYTYREHWKKGNITFNKNGTVSYQTKKYYYFERSMSAGPEDDLVHTINVPVTVAVDRVKYGNKLVKLALSSLLQVVNSTAFITKTVNQLVWGYDDPLLDLGNKFLPPDKRIPFKKFGFFYERNGSTDGLFNVFTGAKDIKRYSTIDKFNHNTSLHFWKTAECNMLNGTDGTSYPPGITRNSTLYLFNENICRSLPLTFHSEVEQYGIKGFRFSPPSDVFASVSTKKANECYCTGGPPCIGGGVFNISVCQFDTPTIMSWPHFFQADQKYRDAVVGLNPDPEKHQLYIDVAPRTGFPLSAQARLQISIATLGVPEIKAVANMTDLIFPVVWFEDGVAELSDGLIALLQKSSDLPQVIKSSLLMVFFIFGAIMFVACIVMFLHIQFQKRSHLDISQKDTGHANPMVSSDYPD